MTRAITIIRISIGLIFGVIGGGLLFKMLSMISMIPGSTWQNIGIWCCGVAVAIIALISAYIIIFVEGKEHDE